MSEQQRVSATLVPITLGDGETYEQYADNLLKQYGVESKDYYDTRLEQLRDIYDNDEIGEYLFIDSKLYKVIDRVEHDPYSAYVNVAQNLDGSFQVEAYFYNGGTCFAEMAEDGLKEFTSKN